MISHWDEVRTWRGERGHIAGTWSSLTGLGLITRVGERLDYWEGED